MRREIRMVPAQRCRRTSGPKCSELCGRSCDRLVTAAKEDWTSTIGHSAKLYAGGDVVSLYRYKTYSSVVSIIISRW